MFRLCYNNHMQDRDNGVEKNPAASSVSSGAIEWSAQDSKPQKRSVSWYIIWLLIIITLAGAAFAVHFFTGEWHFWSTVGLAAIVFIALIIIGRTSSAAVTNYAIDGDNIYINNKQHRIDEFRAFGINNDGGNWVVSLIPIKRLSTGMALIIPEDKGEAIIDLLGSRLPMENTSNIIDQISRRFKL